jgi:hypothetical protein
MKANETLHFGDVLYSRAPAITTVMVVQPTIGRNDFGGGWFTGLIIETSSRDPLSRHSIGEIGAFQRGTCRTLP